MIADEWKLGLKAAPEGEKMFAEALAERFDPALCNVWLEILKTTTLDNVRKLSANCLQSWGGWQLEDIEKGKAAAENAVNMKYDVPNLVKRYRQILIAKRLIHDDSDEKISLLWIAHASNDPVAHTIEFRLLTID